jgi:amino acid transporter
MADKYSPDEEKSIGRGNGYGNTSDIPEWATAEEAPREPWRRRFVDSFKRDPNAHVTKAAQQVNATEGGGRGHTFDHAAAAERTANSGLAHKLKGRHMQMIAIGGSIGMLNPIFATFSSHKGYHIARKC